MTYHHKSSGNAFCRPIGIYVDHHGEGQRQRALAIAKQAPGYFTLLGSGLKGKSDAMPIVELPEAADDAPAASAAKRKSRGQCRLSKPWGRQRRLQRIADWIDAAEPALLLIDSCVEVANLARQKGVPTVYMRLSGKRDDPAHLRAFAGAEAVLCPFHALLESAATPQWLTRHSRYFPGLTQKSRPPHARAAAAKQNGAAAAETSGKRIMLIVAGHECFGKKHMTAKTAPIIKAAESLPDWHIQVIGQNCPKALRQNCPANLHFYGWVEQTEAFIDRAELVVGAASDCLISAVAAAGKPFICVPQRRPFNEQDEKAACLAKLGAATICRRWPRNWQKAVRKTLKRGAVMAALHDDNAAAKAAEFLLSLAYGSRQTAYNSFVLSARLAASLSTAGAVINAARRPGIMLWQKHGAKPARQRKAA